jgi:cytidylate kinase
MTNIIIAIDGTSASGKGTLSKLVAKEMNFAYLDTGLMYRYLAYLAQQNNCIHDEEKIIKIAKTTNFSEITNIEILKSDEIASITSKYIAKITKAREVLNAYQIDFGKNPNKYSSESKNGAILDGRDIGTKIFPNATYKFFITASTQERANRRYKELTANNSHINYQDILISLQKRDVQDRENGNLIQANDAIIIDTTNMNIEESFACLKKYIIK